MQMELDPDMVVRRPAGAPSRARPGGDLLWLPAEDFVAGATVTRSFPPVEASGALGFTLSTDYERPAARGTWTIRVAVNGSILERWRGAVRRGDVEVRVTGLHAGDVVSVSLRAARSHAGEASWSRATRLQVTSGGFAAGERSAARRQPRVQASFHDPLLSPDHLREDDGIRVAVEDLVRSPWSLLDLPEVEPHRVTVCTEFFALPLLVVKRPGATSTTVLVNGAVDLRRSKGRPVFQRSTWFREIEGHQIYVCDPGTVGEGALSLSWGQLPQQIWAMPEAARIVQCVADRLGCPMPDQRTYFGSSAGGHWALALAHFDPGSRALVNNPQLDWTRWMADAVRALLEARFPGMDAAAVRERFPQRASVLRLMEGAPDPVRVRYLVNTASAHDAQVDLPQVLALLEERPELRSRWEILPYSDPQLSHNPLPKEALLAQLSAPWP